MKTVRGGEFQLRVVVVEFGVIGGRDDEAEAEISGTHLLSSSPRNPECEKYRPSAHCTFI